MSERRSEPPSPRELIDIMLNTPGEKTDSYNRFHTYSLGNRAWLLAQGCPSEPIGNYRFWQSIGRQVKRGSSAYYILRPITIRTGEQDEDGEEITIKRFKPVKSVFPVSMTEGEPLPEFQPREWSATRALGALAIKQVPFQLMDGNPAGYSYGRNVAINPVAPYPHKTLVHEMAHIEHGHTDESSVAEYLTHRGHMEFEAEGTAYLVMNDIDPDEKHHDKAVMRGYVASWLNGAQPADRSIMKVISTADRILTAGRDVAGAELSTAKKSA